MRTVQLVRLEWNSNQDMLGLYNKSNISSTTLPIELNTQIILYLRDTMMLMQKKLQSSSLLLKVSMRDGITSILKKEAIQTLDTIDLEDWE
jgi:hypothetical protein